jgi:hypothetical protein
MISLYPKQNLSSILIYLCLTPYLEMQDTTSLDLREFEKLYDMLHIAGYYRGLLYDVNVVKDALKATKSFIEYTLPRPLTPRARV